MRAVVQKVSEARVEVDGQVTGQIGPGLLVLLGVSKEDGPAQATWMAEKVSSLRIFQDQVLKMNSSLLETGGSVLVVSQFTLWGDCRKGARPSYSRAAPSEDAEPLYEAFCEDLRKLGLKVETGIFGAMMEVHLVNQGPVTLLIDTEKQF